MSELNAFLTPGMRVRNPNQPDWGIGQIQSNVAGKITVNFPNEGKVVLDSMRVSLDLVLDG